MPWLLAAASATSVSVSSPASGSTVSSSFTINAKASSTRAITSWYIYADSKAVWHTTNDVASISAPISLSSGKHTVLVRAWDSSGAYGTATLYLTVGTSGTAPTTGVPQAPSYAKVITSIENKSGWGHCSDCAATPSDPTPPIASWVFQQFQSTPSMDGSSTKMKISGSTPYANVLHWVKFGNQNAYRNFIWEFYVNGDQASLNAQNLEFDLFQAVNHKKYMFGTQCNYKKGIWQGWNYINKWVDFPSVPCKKFTPGTWTRVVWYLQRTTDGRMRYISLTVGNTTYQINSYQPVGSTTWGDTFGVQFQQDMDKYATDYTVWVDKVKVSMW
jgi:hypothetical protein